MPPLPPTSQASVTSPVGQHPWKNGAHLLVGDPVGVTSQQAPLVSSAGPGKPLTPAGPKTNQDVIFSGVALIVVRSIALVWGAFFKDDSSMQFLGIMVYVASALVCLYGIVSLVPAGRQSELRVPRGCEFVPVCLAARDGCYTCPCVPWTLGSWGAIAFVVSLSIASVNGFSAVAIDCISGTLLLIFGASWVQRLRQQDGYYCCTPDSSGRSLGRPPAQKTSDQAPSAALAAANARDRPPPDAASSKDAAPADAVGKPAELPLATTEAAAPSPLPVAFPPLPGSPGPPPTPATTAAPPLLPTAFPPLPGGDAVASAGT